MQQVLLAGRTQRLQATASVAQIVIAIAALIIALAQLEELGG